MKKRQTENSKPDPLVAKRSRLAGIFSSGQRGKRSRATVLARLRANFLTGLVIAAPIGITVYITWWLVSLIDNWVKPLIPAAYHPDTYMPFTIPGFGLVIALIGLTLLGALTANLFGRTIVAYGEDVLDRMPVVRNLYKALKQIFQTVLSQSSHSFRQVGLIEYPRPGLYALVFIATTTGGEVAEKTRKGEEMLSVFLPTTPNPTSGYLLFVPAQDVTILDMTVEEAAKMVISAGLVEPGDDRPDARPAGAGISPPRPAKSAGKS